MAGCPFIFLGTDPLARGSKLAQGRRSQRVTIGRYDRSLVRDDSMSLMIPYDSQDFPSAYGIGQETSHHRGTICCGQASLLVGQR